MILVIWMILINIKAVITSGDVEKIRDMNLNLILI
jgi:hypothetical protein